MVRIRAVPLLALLACSGTAVSGVDSIVAEEQEATPDTLAEIARRYVAEHGDGADFLVLWGDLPMGPGSSFYLPLKNDVPGIGYHLYPGGLFDQSAGFGSQRLQGIIWMGPGWMNEEAPQGPRSVLGILAQEVGHRWGVDVWFEDSSSKAPSTGLLGDPYHWGFFVDTGSSPMGGNSWVATGPGIYTATPVDDVSYSLADLYLMGLLESSAVPPILTLANVRELDGSPMTRYSAISLRVSDEVAVMADPVYVDIEQIITVEGERNPAVGYSATRITMAWAFVSTAPAEPPASLGRLKDEWPAFFAGATGGRAEVDWVTP